MSNIVCNSRMGCGWNTSDGMQRMVWPLQTNARSSRYNIREEKTPGPGEHEANPNTPVLLLRMMMEVVVLLSLLKLACRVLCKG